MKLRREFLTMQETRTTCFTSTLSGVLMALALSAALATAAVSVMLPVAATLAVRLMVCGDGRLLTMMRMVTLVLPMVMPRPMHLRLATVVWALTTRMATLTSLILPPMRIPSPNLKEGREVTILSIHQIVLFSLMTIPAAGRTSGVRILSNPL